MPITNYSFAIPGGFPSLITPAPNGTSLEDSIAQDAAITIPLDSIDVNVVPNQCDIRFADVLPAPDEAALNAIVAAHQGIGIVAVINGSLQAVSAAVAVTQDVNWEMLYELETTPKFFTSDINQLLARTIGKHKGDGGQLRIVEQVDGEADAVMTVPPFDFPDTAAAWQKFKADTNVPPREGIRNTYRIEARLNGAASLELRYTTISMIDARVIM